MEYLMYTDIPVIKIAMNNGFASVAAFNKVFKETYQETPSAYRKKKKETVDMEIKAVFFDIDGTIEQTTRQRKPQTMTG